jgi:AAA+ ATPase superfamily predicted ATPase
MKKFVGRKSELVALEREYKRDNGFVVIYGRRRVGKTTLIREFIKNKNAMYFLATEQLETENRKAFLRILAGFTGQSYLENAVFPNWESVFEVLSQFKPDKKKILVIDEFQYLVSTNKAFPSIFQRVWDTILTNKNVMVILCGSLISMMKKEVLSYSSPLYGRRTAQIRLAPFNFYELYGFFPEKSFEDMVKLYSVTGGVPKYVELFDNKLSLMDNSRNEIFSKQGFLFEEPMFLLEKEVTETISYFSIIKAIAAGNHKLGAIAGALGLKTTQITQYLKTLIELELIEKRLPVTENNPEKSKLGLYYIKDNFIEFWFKFAAPYKSELEIENTKAALKKMDAHFVDSHVSFVFEDVSVETLRKLMPDDIQRAGRYWDNKNEIDICALRDDGGYILGECKFHDKPIDADVYFDLQKKLQNIPVFNKKELTFVIFSKSGFTKRLLEISEENSSLLLVDNGQIVK